MANMPPCRFANFQRRSIALPWMVLFLSLINISCAFVPSHSFIKAPIKHKDVLLYSSKDNDDREEGGMDLMRQMLESSWDSQTMGDIPGDSKAAASAAASCLLQAKAAGEKICFVDLLLPAYDIEQGSNIYDEVLAMEFCIGLVQSLEQQSLVLVRDQTTLDTATRVLEAREREFAKQQMERENDDENEEDNFDNNDVASSVESVDLDDEDDEDDYIDSISDVTDEALAKLEDQMKSTNEKDVSEVVVDEKESSTPQKESNEKDQPSTPKVKADPVSADKSDLDSFRAQMLANWDDNDEEEEEETTEAKATDDNQVIISTEQIEKQNPRKRRKPRTLPKSSKSFRLSSLFGSDTISTGIDMSSDVVQALKDNALPADSEEIIVVLSAVSMEETMAIRSLVGTYSDTKSFVFVNCKVDPLPRELREAETVYSLLPLIARPTVLEGNVFGESQQQEEETPKSPKVVVLRRYPEDWQIHIDVDGASGFELAETVPASSAGRRGPPMEYIVSSVKAHLQRKEYGM